MDHEEGAKKVFDNAYTTSRAYELFTKHQIKNPAVEKLAEDGSFPYWTEGRQSYEMIEKIVSEWLDKAGDEANDKYALDFYEAMRKSSEGQDYELPEYTPENMKYLITIIAFTVTAYHELIGHIPDYVDSPFQTGFRIPRDSPTHVDLQVFFP